MAEPKLTRELESRETQMRPKQWAPAELLPEPDKQPGFNSRWVRVATLNNVDPRNLSAKMREGWEPVHISEQPKFQLLIDPASRFKDNVEVGGLLLCKTPEELVAQRNGYYQRQSEGQMESVDNSLMRQNDPRMPLFNERKSSSSFGKGN